MPIFRERVVKSLISFVILIFAVSLSTAQDLTPEQSTAVKAVGRALGLFQQQRFADAVPDFEIAVKFMPDEAKLRFMYGWCLVAKSKQVKDVEEAKQLSAKALVELKKAKELGLQDEANDALIRILGGEGGGSGKPSYSENPEAEKLMHQAEGFFAQSKYDEALKLFEKVLILDPKLYMAGTSGGDCYVAKQDFKNAEIWYQKAIAIDPNRETAWRYSATPFMKQKKYDEARDRYVEAYIVEPYNSMSTRGINQWAQIVGKNLGHPQVSVPEFTISPDGTFEPKTPIAADDKDKSPWLAYLSFRSNWIKEKYMKPGSGKTQYRSSLAEESEALRAAVKSAQEKKSGNKDFERLAKLDADGLIEPFLLLGMPNSAIAEDHPEYLKSNRAKLRQYVLNYVIKK